MTVQVAGYKIDINLTICLHLLLLLILNIQPKQKAGPFLILVINFHNSQSRLKCSLEQIKLPI